MEEDGRQVADARPEHLYGTTLVAGVLLPQAVVLLQQGDGCCVVADEGGRFYAPIPEDERCVGNMTSSLCDEDAAARMRRGVYSRKRMVPLACFVGTDGVDKSLFGEEALFDFCAELMLLSCDGMAPEEEVSNRVRHHLEKLAEDGAAWGDLDRNSEKRELTAADARLVLRMAVGLETEEGLKLPATPAGF
jgi:hypothetical protein